MFAHCRVSIFEMLANLQRKVFFSPGKKKSRTILQLKVVIELHSGTV